MMFQRFIAIAAAASALWSFGCSKKVPEAQAPLRPQEKEEVDNTPIDEKNDCEPVQIGDETPALTYRQRSVQEAQNLANEGFDSLRSAEERGVGRSERERMIGEAVDKFITALAADPYNVHATYNLAAAYARIRRVQCSVNLLGRLVPLRNLASKKANVEEKLDRLFGRGKYRNNLDPDFGRLRDDKRFRELAKQLQKP